jgi:hypothetical protein
VASPVFLQASDTRRIVINHPEAAEKAHSGWQIAQIDTQALQTAIYRATAMPISIASPIARLCVTIALTEIIALRSAACHMRLKKISCLTRPSRQSWPIIR